MTSFRLSSARSIWKSAAFTNGETSGKRGSSGSDTHRDVLVLLKLIFFMRFTFNLRFLYVVEPTSVC